MHANTSQYACNIKEMSRAFDYAPMQALKGVQCLNADGVYEKYYKIKWVLFTPVAIYLKKRKSRFESLSNWILLQI